MARWQPNADTRLRDAALELYAERGFDQTTVAEIAERAGLTARTFFNHYADKRDVLFSGSAALQEGMARVLDAAPASTSPLDAVMEAIGAAGALVGRDRDFSRRRHAVVAANPPLHERELVKLASLTAALADGLRRRGVPEGEARMTAEVGITVFRVGFEAWATAPDDDHALGDHLREALARVRQVATPDPSADGR